MSAEQGHFLTSGVQLHHLRGKRKAILMTEVIYVDAHNRRHTAHPGLLLDGRSGRGLYYLIGTPYDSSHLEAAVIHDWYCAKARSLTGSARKELRRKADNLFAECLITLGVTPWKCAAMPWAVRQQARATQNEEVAHWSRNFISEEASHMGAENPWHMVSRVAREGDDRHADQPTPRRSHLVPTRLE